LFLVEDGPGTEGTVDRRFGDRSSVASQFDIGRNRTGNVDTAFFGDLVGH
jgi:hypothetical protein